MIEIIETLPEGLSPLATSAIQLDTGDLFYEGGDDHETFSRLGTDLHGTKGTLYATEQYHPMYGRSV